MKSQNKKVVDLIYLEDIKPERQLIEEYKARIKTWVDWLEEKQSQDHLILDAYIEEQTEFYMVNNVLKHFLSSRLDWIEKSVADPELRVKYLSVLIPFSQRGNIKQFLTHFFQLVNEEAQENRLKFEFLSNSEREVKILWDVYKLTKTIQSITTMQKAADSDEPFQSMFPAYQVDETLSTLKEVTKLLIKICIKPLYQKSIQEKFPLDVFDADKILKRKEADEYLVTDIVLEKYDYRNYLFYIYFRPSIKAIYQNEELVFKFNYLDYEIIRQEFLMDWVTKRLRNNSKKQEIFENYMYGSATFAEIIEKNPSMELTLLKKLPKNVFDDLISAVNEAVDHKDRIGIDPMSEIIGAFAKQFKRFNLALSYAGKSISQLKKIVLKPKPEPIKTFDYGNAFEEDPTKDEGLVKVQKSVMKKTDIRFPYFCEQNSLFSKQHALFKSKMGDRYKGFHASVSKHLISLSENKLIKRRTPRHEWAIGYFIEEPDDSTSSHLLILGADVKANPLSMGYASKIEEKYTFKPYFVYGTKTKITGLGSPSEERTAKGEKYHIYDFSNPQVIKKALKLLDQVINSKGT